MKSKVKYLVYPFHEFTWQRGCTDRSPPKTLSSTSYAQPVTICRRTKATVVTRAREEVKRTNEAANDTFEGNKSKQEISYLIRMFQSKLLCQAALRNPGVPRA